MCERTYKEVRTICGELVLLPRGFWCLNVQQTWILPLSCLPSFIFKNLFIYLCVWGLVCVEARGQLVGVRFLLCRSHVLNSFHQAWLQEPWSTRLSHWFMEIFFKASVAPWLYLWKVEDNVECSSGTIHRFYKTGFHWIGIGQIS